MSFPVDIFIHHVPQLGKCISLSTRAEIFTVAPFGKVSAAKLASWKAVFTFPAIWKSVHDSPSPKHKAPHSVVPAGHCPQQTGPCPSAPF